MADDAADDMFDAALRDESSYDAMVVAGARPCEACKFGLEEECPACHDTGWLSQDGQPVEAG